MKSIFIILNYNCYKLTENLALKVASMNCIDNVIVVDNCSLDDSFQHLSKIKNEKIDVIRSEKNGGYSYGNNYGAKYCKKYNPDILFICNPDVDVEEEDIIKIINCFKKYNYSILSGIEYNLNNEIVKPPIWKLNKYKDDLKECYFLCRKIEKIKNKIPIEYDKEVQDVDIVKGSLFAVNYKDFIEVSGFDENIFLFCEETVLARKMLDKNKKIGIVTSAKYKHNHSTTINKAYKSKAKQIKLLYKSRLYYNKKYNKIGIMKRIILKLSMNISILEYYVYDIFNMIRRRYK